MISASLVDKGSLNHQPLDSLALDGTAAGDTQTGRTSRRRLSGPDTAAHAQVRARNKLAATRYRLRTQTSIAKAEEAEREVEFRRNAKLACVDRLREEVLQLKNELLEQASCGCPLIRGYLSDVTRTLSPSAYRREHPEHSNHPKPWDDPSDLQGVRQPHHHHHQLQPPLESVTERSSEGGEWMTKGPHPTIAYLPDGPQMMMPLPHPESQPYPY
ncbi:hypothetical protein B0I37DRAFT_371817 [Chaetomium sp. MPI-CAGE-AT-0009]|nr:hypothetical protein B0I37DRAFT_371817 [Chaetomium sp. MPI-CAGE-AT-0009]